MDELDSMLLAELTGALEPGESDSLVELLRSNPTARLKKVGLAYSMGTPVSGPDIDVQLSIAGGCLSGGESAQVGQRVTLKISAELPKDQIRLVCIRKCGEGLKLLYPLNGHPWHTLAAFAAPEEGMAELNIVLEEPQGTQEFYMILLPSTYFRHVWEASDLRWRQLLEVHLVGSLPGQKAVFQVC